jgi:hypothetical protein
VYTGVFLTPSQAVNLRERATDALQEQTGPELCCRKFSSIYAVELTATEFHKTLACWFDEVQHAISCQMSIFACIFSNMFSLLNQLKCVMFSREVKEEQRGTKLLCFKRTN